MKRNIALHTLCRLCLLMLFAWNTAGAQIQISGAPSMQALEDTPNRLQVYMLNTANVGTVTLRFPATDGGKLYRYTLKAIDAEEVTAAALVDGMWVLQAPQLNCGYFVSDAARMPQYYWVCNYADYALSISQVTAHLSQTSPCLSMDLVVDADVLPITFYQPNGVPRILARGMQVSYPDMKWEASARQFLSSVTEVAAEVSEDRRTITVEASLADAVYTIRGDRFTKGLSLSAPALSTDEMPTSRVEVYAFVDKADGTTGTDETTESETGNLVSAPFAVSLSAYGNEPSAAHFVWRIYRSTEGPENSILVYNGTSTDFTFREAGTYSILLQATNRIGTCNDEVLFENLYQVAESSLTVPNAFSPYGSPGVNDIFRVKYSSLVRFDGRIFDRWGKQIFRWTNPDDGWDGKYNGKQMPTGVYFYVIEAEGADGIKYKKKGDINILRAAYEVQPGGTITR
ncbi:gliding motility-associated C-terminal domain-containing protein [Porphyromonas loveana]|uniref:gliding motility-associated C-terminal domain-containing protein n=1 Tax=Porphyromonas loveana TaxID=1884669 RepID=UPI00359FD45D